MANLQALKTRVATRLAQPVDAASLVYFRVVLGLTITWEMSRYWVAGWADRYWATPTFHFTYPPFDGWLLPLSSFGMHTVLVVVGIAGAGMAVGYRYRVSSAIACLGLSYLFLLDQATYLNHFYLLCVVTFLAGCLPLAGYFSFDARRGANSPISTVPTWVLWLVLLQLTVPYVGGGIAKISPDWLAGEPARLWLSERTGFPLIGQWFKEEWAVSLMSIGGLLLDLCGPFLLLHKRTQRWAFLVFLVFHTLNSRLFRIGIFPWFMIASMAIYLAPDLPRRIWRDIKGENARGIAALLVGFVFGFMVSSSFPRTDSPTQAVCGGLGWAIFAWHVTRWNATGGDAADAESDTSIQVGNRTLIALGVWVAIQVLVPLRHLTIPGDVNWTELGHYYSWHMKVRDKDNRAAFFLQAPGKPRVRLRPENFLSRRQVKKMIGRPTLIVQFAHHVADLWEEKHGERPIITSWVMCSLNARPRQLLIDPKVDLAALPWPLGSRSDFIVPLTTPLKPSGTH